MKQQMIVQLCISTIGVKQKKIKRTRNRFGDNEKQLVLLVTALTVYIEMYGCKLSEAYSGEGWRLNGNVRTQDEITAVIKAKILP